MPMCRRVSLFPQPSGLGPSTRPPLLVTRSLRPTVRGFPSIARRMPEAYSGEPSASPPDAEITLQRKLTSEDPEARLQAMNPASTSTTATSTGIDDTNHRSPTLPPPAHAPAPAAAARFAVRGASAPPDSLAPGSPSSCAPRPLCAAHAPQDPNVILSSTFAAATDTLHSQYPRPPNLLQTDVAALRTAATALGCARLRARSSYMTAQDNPPNLPHALAWEEKCEFGCGAGDDSEKAAPKIRREVGGIHWVRLRAAFDAQRVQWDAERTPRPAEKTSRVVEHSKWEADDEIMRAEMVRGEEEQQALHAGFLSCAAGF
ncbi:hypothetical protein C8J57DRAFT_1718736 [Mycena rebaudengoi]|nr:hypothetical protein C8J57DRAFT_1718736 [Mycena rebaudengoi]